MFNRIKSPIWVMFFILLGSLNSVSNGQILHAFTEPVRVSKVAASEPGIVRCIHIKEGDPVKQGQVLAELDQGVFLQSLEAARSKAGSTAKIDAARSSLKIRKQRYEQLNELTDNGHANNFELEEAFEELNSADAQLRLAIEERELAAIEVKRIQAQLERRVVRSPFDGVVTKVHKEVGEYVSGSEPILITVVNLDQLRARFYLSASVARELVKGQVLKVCFAPPSESKNNLPTFPATIDFVSPIVEPKSGTAQVDVLINNQKHLLQSGTECNLQPID